MKKLLYLIVWITLISTEVLAQNQLEKGFPAITNYSPKEYDAFRQNWIFAQDKRGIIYVGNTDGLLEFDGNTWQLHTVPNKSGILGMDFSSDGKLFVGAQGDLGYFASDSQGKLTFYSLLDHLPEENQDFSNVTETYFNQGKVYFNSEKYLLIWDIEKKEFEVIPSKNGFHVLFKANDTIYIREWGVGLKVLKNGSLSLLEGGEQFENERIYSILPFPDEPGVLLIVTRSKGFFKYDGISFEPFKTEVDQFIKDNVLYLPGTVLRDGHFLLGTLNGGAIIIDKEGRKIAQYNQNIGIINNTVYFSFQDQAGGIWLGTENGISRIDYETPVSYFDYRSNITSYSHDIIRFKGLIYASTADGIYTLDPKTSVFNHLSEFNIQSWDFLEVDDDLLVGTSDGLYQIELDKLIPIKKTIGNEFIVNELVQSKLNPNRVFLGVNSGIWSVVKEKEDWIAERQILEVSDQATSLVEDPAGNVWMGTFSNGVFKVNFPQGPNQIEAPLIENFDQKDGLQDGIAFVKKINENVYIITTDSIYRFDDQKKRFEANLSDPVISNFYSIGAIFDYVPVKQDFLGRIWMGNKQKITVGEFKNENWTWTSFPLRRISDEAIYAYFTEENGVTWFASGEGFIKYDFSNQEKDSQSFSTLIRNVATVNDSTIYFGGDEQSLDVPELLFKNNQIKFRFSATSYERKGANQFSTFLEGFDENWSPWSLETVKSYTNLSPGEYTFLVKSSNIHGVEGSPASYSFLILPPWYRTWWAYLIYSFIITSLIYAIVQIRAFYLKKENRILDEKVQHRTRQLNKSLEDLKSTQAQLIQSEKMASLGELTAGIAHEIQNPLNFVNNFSEVSKELLEELGEEIEKQDWSEVNAIKDDLKENLTRINQHGKRAGAIVRGMLEHSRTNKGKKGPTNLNVLVEEFVRLSSHGFRAKDEDFNSDFKLELDPDLPKVNVVAADIGRVILNLVNNAFYAVNEQAKKSIEDYKPQVIVGSKKTEKGIEISIKDNGPGIPKQIKQKIFQPFFTTKPTGSGTGLGLSLSYDIVKAHGGELKVESPLTSEGGTEFKLILRFV
ncbi:ATP-binding protein [Algoriphagus namhaensis]|uniref:histidine kinase n=1 Tax=Algoriphagus namhaensis TaxID=915353 RepID=A0ABV8APE6_9BACT